MSSFGCMCVCIILNLYQLSQKSIFTTVKVHLHRTKGNGKANCFLWSLSLFNVSIKLDTLWSYLEAMSLFLSHSFQYKRNLSQDCKPQMTTMATRDDGQFMITQAHFRHIPNEPEKRKKSNPGEKEVTNKHARLHSIPRFSTTCLPTRAQTISSVFLAEGFWHGSGVYLISFITAR